MDKLNTVEENVWAMVMLGCGVFLHIKGQAAAAGTLIAAALAVFQRKG